MPLRDYQFDLAQRIYSAWAQPEVLNVLATMATGGGKTTVFCHVLKELDRPGVVIAHRQELVSQASLSLAREGIRHGIIAPKPVIQQTIALHMDLYGNNFYNPRAHIRVGGVDTLVGRGADKDRWYSQCQTAVVDEGHHVLATNKWGKCLTGVFPNARGLFVTAHALRADGCGLGRSLPGRPNDGLADALVVGPYYRNLIDRGFLCDYRLVCPPSDVDVSEVEVGSTGDFKPEQLRAAVHKSKTIVGDVVENYMQFAAGMLGLTFAVDLDFAAQFAAAYRAKGIPAEIITGETPITVRGQLMKKFRRRELLQLVSVDVLGEGTDVPAVEVISLARHTNSFQLYSQQVGRGSRPSIAPEIFAHWDRYTDEQRRAHIAASSKPKFVIIDHVGNWDRHRTAQAPLVCMPRAYSILKPDRKARKAPDDAIPMRTCLHRGPPPCYQPYERMLDACPYCGTPAPPPAGRGSPEQVDGNLFELDPEVLAKMRADVEELDGTPYPPDNLPNRAAQGAFINRHYARQDAQASLRHAMSLWGGWQEHLGRSQSENYRRFYFEFGVDVLTAQAMRAQDATELEMKIRAKLDAANVTDATEANHA